MSDRHRISVTLIGDSITQQSFSPIHQGWGASLADWYSRTGDVCNRGFSGYNSRWILENFEGVTRSANPANTRSIFDNMGVGSNRYFVTLFLGANDSSDDATDANTRGGGQGVPLAEYKGNMRAIISALKAEITAVQQGQGKTPHSFNIVLVTTPPVNHALWSTRTSERAATYAAAVRELATEEQCHVCDLWTDDPINDNDLHDGLHFGASGNAKMAERVKSVIREKMAELAPDDDDAGKPKVALHLPHWSELGARPPK